ncbi:hypothetical protein [Austwickia chelonae]|uniref:hypothetical protein n=1 Tax=Austwickia chelonae TaxID=100225 RepID=UPI000E21FF33|nr:hypothetical protein [Austwickia chelonae]
MSDPTHRHDYFDSEAEGVADTPELEQPHDEYRYAPVVLIGAAVMLVLAIGTSTWTLHNATRGTSSTAVAAKAGHTSSASPTGAGQTPAPSASADGQSPKAEEKSPSATAPVEDPKPTEKSPDPAASDKDQSAEKEKDKAADKADDKVGDDKADKKGEPAADRSAAPAPKPAGKNGAAPAESADGGDEGTLSLLSELSTSIAPSPGRPVAYLQIHSVGTQNNFVTPPSGSKTWSAADILAAHKSYQATFPSAKLMSWKENGRRVWSTAVTNSEWKTREDAVKWCQSTYSSYGPYEKSTALRSRCYVP